MFSSSIKRSVATLGVLAGLLAVAGPASAQILDGPVLAKAGPRPEVMIIDANNLDRVFLIRGDAQDTQTSRASSLQNTLVSSHAKAGPQPEVSRYLATDPSSEVDNSLKVKAAAGTQVGSEGLKDDAPLETISFAFKGEVIGLEPNALGTQVGSEGVKASNLLSIGSYYDMPSPH